MQNLNVALARKIAQERHKDQKDKAGKPYMKHLQFVADHVSSDDEKVVAYLHDSVEDTAMPLEEIEALFGTNIAEAVDAMTHRKGVEYMDYVANLAKNPLARAVKKADLTNNMMIERIPNPTEKDYARIEKYRRAYDYLTSLSE